MADESRFPTVADLAATAAELVAGGFGDLPIQLVVVPDSTLQALAAPHGKSEPAKMIEYGSTDGRFGVCFYTTDGTEMPSREVQ